MSVLLCEDVGGSRADDRAAIMHRLIMGFVCASFLIVSGCAFDLVHIQQVPVAQTTISADKPSWRLGADISLIPARGNKIKLKGGTAWHYVCTIEQGDVYKTKDQIVSVRASNIYEAYIVISSAKMMGFYLPLEKTFSPLREPTPIVMEFI